MWNVFHRRLNGHRTSCNKLHGLLYGLLLYGEMSCKWFVLFYMDGWDGLAVSFVVRIYGIWLYVRALYEYDEIDFLLTFDKFG